MAAASGCQVPAEADAIVDHLRHLLVAQEYRGTIGVVTPFREQAKRITDRIAAELPPHLIANSQLGAFTAHQFQGDARDLILLSLCLGPDMPLGSRSFLAESANLMNVAVSRARAVCHVFGNRNEALTSGIPHLVKLAAIQGDGKEHAQVPSVFESPWEEILYLGLKARGIDPIPQFPIAGRRLDLAVIQGNIRIDVEVDGDQYHRDMNGRRKSSDLWRDHQLKSLGWRVKRYWVYQLRENLDECLDDIIATANP
jgi:very-short-patch-repair endonuclease